LNSYLFYENKLDTFLKAKLSQNEIAVSQFFSLWTNTLLEIAIENSLYNQYLIDPFIILFRVNLSHGKKKIFKEFRLLGQYNFDELMKAGASEVVLESYFYIVSQLSENINYLQNRLENKPVTFTKFEKINNDYKTYQVYKTFFNNFNQQVIKEQSDCYSLFYKEEVGIKDNSYYMFRFNNAVNDNILISYLSGKIIHNLEYGYHPSVDYAADSKKDVYLSQLESMLDYMITAINYNILTVDNVKSFIGILNQLDKSSFYEDHLQEVLLTSSRLIEKLITVCSYILNPTLYFGVKINNKEELWDHLRSKYDNSVYKHTVSDKTEFNKDHNERLLITLYSLTEINQQLRNFISKEYTGKVSTKRKHESK
jgi:hypothetical protein